MSQDHELKSIKAQLEAHKGMLNEQLQMSIQLRTNLVLFQQAFQEANQKVADLEKRIADLTPKPVEPEPTPDGA